ncbi:MAG: HEAT repeat domain-containing protein, partial [Myxococcota bacterium]
DVRSAAITAFCAVGNERAVHAVRPFLIDAESRVRAATVTAMIRHGGLDGILTAAETLKTFLNSEQAQERLHGARILRDIKVKNFFQPVLTLLQDHDVQVRIAAVEAAGQMRSPELVPALIYRLADAPTAMTAVRALVAYGPSIEPTLFKVLQNPKEDLRVRRRIPRILERFGRQEAFAHLVRALASQDPELRAQVARAASRIRERHPRLTVDEGHLTIAVRDQLEAAYRVLAIIMALDLPTGHLLSEALLERHRQHLDLAFGLLEIRYPARTIQLVHANLDAEHRVIRANALEVVDNVLDKEEARILLPLLEDHSLQEKVQKGRETFPLASRSDDDWLHVLIEDAHPWIVSCTLHHVAEQGLTRFMPQVIARLDDRDPIVRETAVVALDRLLTLAPQAAQPAEWLAQLRRLSDGDVLEVRRVAADVLARRTETADAS